MQPEIQNFQCFSSLFSLLQVKVDPILLISSTSKCSPTSCPGISSNLFDNFLILSQIRPHPSPSGPPSSTPPPLAPGLAGVVLSLPGVLLESAKSHVLEEPVPRLSRANTLPWDCTLSGLSAFTFSGAAHMDYVVEPVVIKTTLAAQREGVGVTIHSDLVAISLSKKQVCAVGGLHPVIIWSVRVGGVCQQACTLFLASE